MPVGLSFVFVFVFFCFLILVFCFLFFVFFLKIFICLLCTCNASLHCKYTKVVNIIHICTKIGKYCTNFVNVYKFCQFFCVYNINLHCN